MGDNIKLPPLHYDELPEPGDAIPAMRAYARKAIKADRQRRGEQVAPTSDDNTLTIAYICGYNDSKRSTSPEGWKPVPVEPIYNMTQAGVNLALSSPQTWRRKMTNETILPEHTQKGDMRFKDGKLWVCSDPDINRWVCPDDRGWQLVPKEPTDEMKKVGCRVPLNKAARHNACYKVMLSAAPKFGEEE